MKSTIRKLRAKIVEHQAVRGEILERSGGWPHESTLLQIELAIRRGEVAGLEYAIKLIEESK